MKGDAASRDKNRKLEGRNQMAETEPEGPGHRVLAANHWSPGRHHHCCSSCSCSDKWSRTQGLGHQSLVTRSSPPLLQLLLIPLPLLYYPKIGSGEKMGFQKPEAGQTLKSLEMG